MDIDKISKNIKEFEKDNKEKVKTNNGQKLVRDALDTVRQYITPINFETIKLKAKSHFSDIARRHCGRGMGPNLNERQKYAFCSTCDHIIYLCKKLEEGLDIGNC